MSAVLDDLRALDYMIDHDLIESGINRVGAEQEMFLVDRDLRPAPSGDGSARGPTRFSTDH